MAERLKLDLFGEDVAHEGFVGALLRRVMREQGIRSIVNNRSVRGGMSRMLERLQAFQEGIRKGQPGFNKPDLLVVAQDADCKPWNRVRQELTRCIDQDLFPAFALACPNPHIERWFLADPTAIKHLGGGEYQLSKRKCKKGLYKSELKQAFLRGGNVVILETAEYAQELVEAMDLYRAGKNEPSLRHFLDELRGALALLAGRGEQVNSQDS